MLSHEQVHIEWKGEEAEVDAGIAALILASWKLGIPTYLSCENLRDGRAWIEFDVAGAERFLLYGNPKVGSIEDTWVYRLTVRKYDDDTEDGAVVLEVHVEFPVEEMTEVTSRLEQVYAQVAYK